MTTASEQGGLPKDEIARTLINAARDRVGVAPLTDTYPDLDFDTAYEVQDAVAWPGSSGRAWLPRR